MDGTLVQPPRTRPPTSTTSRARRRRHPDLPADRFSNRELSWLDFNARVLAQAEDRRVPLLERLKFLAIFASNLDEFYMVRVAGLKRRLDMGLTVRSADGRSPRETLAQIGARVQELAQRHARCWLDDVEPALADAGIRVLHWAELDRTERDRLGEYFRAQVFPVLTPLAVDPAHPFPYISGLSLNLAVLVRDAAGPGWPAERFARVKVPNNVPRFVDVKDQQADYAYLPMEELIGAHLELLFPGMEVVERHVFRVTRNTDIEVEEDRDEDLLQALERELTRRRFGPAVRLEVTDTITPRVLDLLVEEIDVAGRRRAAGSRDARPRLALAGLRGGPAGPEGPAVRAVARRRASPRTRRPRASSPPCARATCWCTTRTSRSRPACSASSSRRRSTRTCWRSSRRSTAPPATRRWWRR